MQSVNQAVHSHSAMIDPARSQLQRILASAEFAKSPRHREFLTYLVEQEIERPGWPSKETVIAIVVFRRDIAAYDPRLDPIVRIEAGRLRRRLETYYANAGCNDALHFETPKGGYALRFRFKTPDLPVAAVSRVTAVVGCLEGEAFRYLPANDIATMPPAAD